MGLKSSRSMLWRQLALAGPAASLIFGSSLIGFAALRTDGYTHGTKAVSELGAIGAPMASAFNFFGFILPGVLIALLALSIFMLAAPKTARSGAVLLALSGIFTALAGVFPIDMSDMRSVTSTMHAIGALLSGIIWVPALLMLAPVLKQQFGLTILGALSPWFLLFLAANIGWQIGWQTTGLVLPGWGQRIAFAGYFLWSFWAGIAICCVRLKS